MNEQLNHKNAAPVASHYSAAVRCGEMVFISGQLPLDPATRVGCTGNAKEQAMKALENVEKILQTIGGDRSNIVKTTAYTDSMDNWGQINEAYADFFGEYKPARSIVAVSEIHFDYKAEIEAIAIVTPK